MKLIISIVHSDDVEPLLEGLMRAGLRATRLSTTGGFLREGNATILIGVEEEQVPKALEAIKSHTRPRTVKASKKLLAVTQAKEVTLAAATVFLLDLDEIQRF
jgi:uncharacterized protein YaaQ